MKKLLTAIYFLTFILVIFAVIDPSIGTDKSANVDYIAATNAVEPQTDKNTGQQDTNKQITPKEKPNKENNTVQIPTSNRSQPPSCYVIDVCISDQKVRIYKNGTVTKEWTASTGVNSSTPLGSFTIQNRGEWFYSEKYQEGAMWWVSFKDWGIYLFHSIPMDREKNVITEEANKLGTPASHGCIRLELDNAKWIYENIPAGTPVNIHE
ncbi:MAG: L,D-transpeptidase [Syntrophomonas sp.]